MDSPRQGGRGKLRQSGLKNARALGCPMAYDDRIGMTALVIAGRYMQPHLKNRSGQVLFLVDSTKQEAVMTEADQIRVSGTPADLPK